MNANVEVHESAGKFVVGKLLFAFDSLNCDAQVFYEPEEFFCLPNERCGSQRCETGFMCVYRVKMKDWTRFGQVT